MMKFKYPLLALVIVALAATSGCKKDEEGTLQVTFTGSYGNAPLVMYDVHDYIDGQRIQFTRAEFFMSDLNLIDGSGNTYPLKDIELIDLGFTDSGAAEQGVVLTYDKIPAGSYSDLELGYGVASDINATKPSDYPSSSPLSNTARYWTPWNSFVFSRTEGKLDTLVDGTDDPDLGFAYHTGTDALYRNLQINHSLDITDGATTHITFNLDYEKLFGLPTAPIDIKAKPQNHNPLDSVEVQALANNIVTALTYHIE